MSTTGTELEGRKIIITGAASGMGRAIARRFAAESASLALFDIAHEGIESFDRSLAVSVDVTSPEAVHAAVEQSSAAMGGIDGVVNAAGIFRELPLDETEPEIWRRVLDVNLFAPYLVCRAALRYLQAAEKATIVNIASLSALIAPVGMSAYAASKGGLVALTRVLAAELGPKIRSNSIAPGIIKTPMTSKLWDTDPASGAAAAQHLALKRLGEPEEVAEVALFLSGDRSSFMTGTLTAVDGGLSWH